MTRGAERTYRWSPQVINEFRKKSRELNRSVRAAVPLCRGQGARSTPLSDHVGSLYHRDPAHVIHVTMRSENTYARTARVARDSRNSP